MRLETCRSFVKKKYHLFFGRGVVPMPPHVLVDFVVLPPGHGSSVTDFWGWDAQEAQLRCPDDVSGDTGGCSARRVLKPKFYQPTQTVVTGSKTGGWDSEWLNDNCKLRNKWQIQTKLGSSHFFFYMLFVWSRDFVFIPQLLGDLYLSINRWSLQGDSLS